MSKPIKKLTMHHFRGASGKSEICFDTTKPLVMVFGENGSGKSTIADAIDFVANRVVGSLEDRSIGSQKHRYLYTIGQTAERPKVEIESDGASPWAAVLSPGAVIKNIGNGSPFRARVLRRSKLLQLVEAQPADRYKALQGFVDVAGVERAEQALRDAEARNGRRLTEAAVILERADRALGGLWKSEGSPGKSAEEWAAAKVAVGPAELEVHLGGLREAVRLLDNLAKSRDSLDRASTAVDDRSSGERLVSEQIRALPKVDGAEAVPLVDLLKQAQEIIAPPNDLGVCPVCEQPITADDLRNKIKKRLSEMQSHLKLADSQKKAAKALADAKAVHATAIEDYIAAARRAGAKLREIQPPTAQAAVVPWERYRDFLESSSIDEAQLAAAQKLQADILAIDQHYRERLQATQADLNKYNAIGVAIKGVVENREAAQSLESLGKRLKGALQICEAARKSFTQHALEAVYEEINRLYAVIHPREPLGPLRLRMSPSKRGSIEQDATFAGHPGVPPQAYFSESHLDTLGFCVWIALAKRDHAKETVIVLDDIFTSVDGGHLYRIMQALGEVAKDFAQVIVMTHYRAWRDRYRLSQGPSLSVQLLELHPWTMGRGVLLSGTKLAVDELESALGTLPLPRQSIASQAGILLEAILDRLTLQYHRRLPRKRDNDWALGELLAGCKKLFDVLVIEASGAHADAASPPASESTVMTAVQPFFEEMGPLVFIRNQVGCHFNLGGAEVADADVEAFGKATVGLVRALTCPQCGDIPDRADGTHFRCGCKQTKMTPLVCDK